MGFVDANTSTSVWDNYQCKHYDHKLAPSEIWIEIGKLCYHTWVGDFTVPRYYYFVAPQGVGAKLFDLINNPDQLRSDLLAIWGAKCERKILSTRQVKLEGEFLKYVMEFNFQIFRELPPAAILDQHRRTRYHAVRFGGGLQRPRPRPLPTPTELIPEETRYVAQLLEAYSDHVRAPILNPADLSAHPGLERHLTRQREAFYRAAALRQFERDTLPDASYFDGLKDQIYRGVREVCEDDHETGYRRVKATVQAARMLPCESYILSGVLETDDKAGICHHLANDDLLRWCPNGC